MNKIDAKTFIIELLKHAECKSIKENESNINCQCPYHRSSHNFGNFGINFKKEDELYPFNCFSCHETGNLITLIKFIYKCTYYEAEKIFLKRIVQKPITLEVLKEDYRKLKRYKTYENIISVELPQNFGIKGARLYLEKRNKISHHGILDIDYLINKYEIYYCDSGRYSQRIIMPIKDKFGKNVYFTNRATFPSNHKNLFPQNTNPLNYLYGLYESLGYEKVIIVEGPFDLFQLKCYCIKNNINDYGIVALMSTILSEERLSLIIENFSEAILLLDHDEAGLKADKIIYSELSQYIPTKTLTKVLKKKKDPGNSNEEQLNTIFNYKHVRQVVF